MYFFAALFFCSLVFATGVLADVDTKISPLGPKTKPRKISKRFFRSPFDTCIDTCEMCFGPTVTECPDGSGLCYELKEGLKLGCNINDGTGGFPGATPGASDAPTACEAQYGDGSLECGASSCYNPQDGDSCCDDGSYCPAGTQCLVLGGVYECSEDGSDASPWITSAGAASSTRTASGSHTTRFTSRPSPSSTSTNSPSAAATFTGASAATRLPLKAVAGIGAIAALVPDLVVIGLL